MGSMDTTFHLLDMARWSNRWRFWSSLPGRMPHWAVVRGKFSFVCIVRYHTRQSTDQTGPTETTSQVVYKLDLSRWRFGNWPQYTLGHRKRGLARCRISFVRFDLYHM